MEPVWIRGDKLFCLDKNIREILGSNFVYFEGYASEDNYELNHLIIIKRPQEKRANLLRTYSKNKFINIEKDSLFEILSNI